MVILSIQMINVDLNLLKPFVSYNVQVVEAAYADVVRKMCSRCLKFEIHQHPATEQV